MRPLFGKPSKGTDWNLDARPASLSELQRRRCVDQLSCRFLHKNSYNKYFLTDLINSFFFMKITCMATFNSRYFVLSVRPIII